MVAAQHRIPVTGCARDYAAFASVAAGVFRNNPAFAKVNYVDHSVTDQTSILRFIEDNWNLGRISATSFDSMAGSLGNLFEFADDGGARKLLLDATTGLPQ